jgi:hypothetical protein
MLDSFKFIVHVCYIDMHVFSQKSAETSLELSVSNPELDKVVRVHLRSGSPMTWPFTNDRSCYIIFKKTEEHLFSA